LVVAALVLVLASLAPAQDTSLLRPSPARRATYIEQEQVDALNRYVTAALGAVPKPDDLLQLSRLLADPRDQVLWLSEWVGRLDERPGHRKQALVLAEKTSDRVDLWKDRGVEQLDPLLKRLERIKANIPSPPWEITDPHELAASLDQIEPTELLPTHRFQLLARGVPALSLDVAATRPPAWDVPRVVVAALAEHGDGSLPAIWKLLDLDRELRAARQRFDAGLPDAPPRTGDTFQIAEALLGRALGVDGADRSPSGDDLPDNWGTLAAQLEEENLWEWAALARLLQAAATTAEAQSRQRIASAAREQCQQTFLVVDPGALPALHTGNTAWLARLEGGELEAPENLPLSRGFRQRAREARASLEQQFLAARNDDEQAFRLMQLAKAADTGLDTTDAQARPLKIAELQDKLGKPKPRAPNTYYPQIHIYLELLEIGEGDCYGLAVYSELATLNQGDSFAVKLIGAGTSEQVVKDALKLVGRGKTWTQGKILIAPDGSMRTARWLETGEFACGVFEHISPGDTGSWVVYVPTAAALNKNSGWTLERALRLWYRSGLQARQPGIDFLRSGRGRSSVIKSFIFREEQLNAKLYAISVAGDYPSDLQKDYLTSGPYRKLLMSAKKSATHTNVLALLVAE